jgi:hypothetical protein
VRFAADCPPGAVVVTIVQGPVAYR